MNSHFTCSFQFSPGTSIIVSSTLLALVLLGRAAFVFPIAYIKNCFQRTESTKIEFRKQVPIADIQVLGCLHLPVIRNSQIFFPCLVHNMVGWPNERCSYYCFMLQPSKFRMFSTLNCFNILVIKGKHTELYHLKTSVCRI